MGMMRNMRSGVLAGIFIVLAGWLNVVVMCATVLAEDQEEIRICVSKIVSHAALDAAEKGFEAGLASSGFREGKNVHYLRRDAGGDLQVADNISKEFMERGNCSLIHAIATPTSQSVCKYLQDVPVVFSAVTDPQDAKIVPEGCVAGCRTGTNVTGVSDKWPVDLQIRTYAKFVPEAKVWGTIYNPKEDNSISHVREMRATIEGLGLKLIEEHATKPREVEAAARSLAGRVQAIAITADNTSVANFEKIAKVCNEHHVALFAGDVDSVPKGAIAAYGTDYFLIGYSAGKKAGLILRGVAPGEIPWGLMEKFSLVINRKAARLQGITIGDEWLRKADKVIE